MSRSCFSVHPAAARRPRRFAWLPALALVAASATGTAPVLAAEPTAQERAQLEKQLDSARGRLDDAARDVAELTNKLYGAEGRNVDVMKFRHPLPFAQGAMLGINIGGEAAGQARADGVEVMGVSPSGPADAAGLRKGDVITAIDGKALKKSDERNGSAGRQLVEHLRGVEPGKVVKVDYLRDGKKLSASVTTVAAEPPMMRMVREHLPMLEGLELPPHFEEFVGGPGRGFRALELVPVTSKLGQYFGTDKGLLVVRAPAAATSRLEEGDVILTIGGRTPENPRHAFRILGSYQPTEQVKVEVLRQRKRLTLDMQVPQDAGPAFRQGPPPPAAPARPPVVPAPVAAPRNGSA
ncbi:MAG TPA: PDZ domain-containing protein [Steroidobacteraceae bacterium]|nr:PDZ domain-containing protein [Steroidobacteraceae bacterium]